jgi:hypothetical protein
MRRRRKRRRRRRRRKENIRIIQIIQNIRVSGRFQKYLTHLTQSEADFKSI